MSLGFWVKRYKASSRQGLREGLGCRFHDDIDDDDDDNHDHHYDNHLSVSLVGRRVSSAHVPADDYGFIDRGATIFVTVVGLGQLQKGCNGSTVTGIGPVR